MLFKIIFPQKSYSVIILTQYIECSFEKQGKKQKKTVNKSHTVCWVYEKVNLPYKVGAYMLNYGEI